MLHCIAIHNVNHKMKLMESDLDGFYMYKLIPMELGYDPKIIYIAPNRAEHWLYGKPMEGGKLIDSHNILYFKSPK